MATHLQVSQDILGNCLEQLLRTQTFNYIKNYEDVDIRIGIDGVFYDGPFDVLIERKEGI